MKAKGLTFNKVEIDPSWLKEPKPGVTIRSFADIWKEDEQKKDKPTPKPKKARKSNS